MHGRNVTPRRELEFENQLNVIVSKICHKTMENAGPRRLKPFGEID